MEPSAAAYTGLISVQDMALASMPELGHGPSVSIAFTEVRAPDYEEEPGKPTGCKVWMYELPERAPRPPTDQGVVTVDGLARGAATCRFDVTLGYVCPGASFPFAEGDRADVGTAGVFASEAGVTVEIEPGGLGAIDFPDVGPVAPGGAFALDAASRTLVSSLPLDESAVTLSCDRGDAGCSPATATVVRISTTDGALAGLPPFAMPPAISRQVEIQCAALGSDGVMTVSATVMRYLKQAHAASPITRIRTAYMREGVAFAANPEPRPPNRATVLVGRGFLGFTSP
jgi:hypothetical protein